MKQSQSNSFLSHLVELRDRLLKIVISTLVVFAILMPFSNDIYLFVSAPLRTILSQSGLGMISTGVLSPFLTPFKLTLVIAFYIAIPYILYQIWAFVAPGLYKNEKKLVAPLAISSTLLFYTGMIFAYLVVFPLMFPFLASTTPEGITLTPDIKEYLDLVLKLFFAFGVAFEVPIATILVVKTGLITPEKLSEKRPYIIVGAFILGMLLTPPDLISQTLLAIPMWLLFEIGLFFSYKINKKSHADTQDNFDDEYEEMTDDEMDAELESIEDDEISENNPTKNH